ncbi:MAG: hypothetical protein H6867_04860 [Rhodospirillales bacterium]|nr:hypothetical protein [Rhodospirillales bacterium]MCB9994831.1 hypothetical protein [Rhodospirillales bacterium]
MAKPVSQAEYARRKKVSRQYVNKLVQQGKIPLDEKKRIDPDIADAVLAQLADPARRLNDEAPEDEYDPVPAENDEEEAAGNAANDHASFARIRTAREGYQAKLAQLDYEERAGKLVKKDDVAKEAYDVSRRLRDRFLALPQELTGTLIGMTDEKEMIRFLRSKIRDVLMEAADDVSLGA